MTKLELRCLKKIWVACGAVDNVDYRCERKRGHKGKHMVHVP